MSQFNNSHISDIFLQFYLCSGSVRNVMNIVVGSGLGSPGSNPERGCLHFPKGKV